MADPISIALVGASAVATIAGGAMEQKAANTEAAQYQEERRTAQVAAQEEEVQRRRMLEESLGTTNALRASRGLDWSTGTGAAFRSRELTDAGADIRTIRINAGTTDKRLALSSSVAKTRGKAAMIGAVGQAAGSLTSYSRRTAAIG